MTAIIITAGHHAGQRATITAETHCGFFVRVEGQPESGESRNGITRCTVLSPDEFTMIEAEK